MRNNFWKGKRVLITGYEGFLGSHLTKELLDRGAKVWGLDILTHRKKTILSRQVLSRVNIAKGSVEDYALVCRIINRNKIGFIFHLAAKALVKDALVGPLEAFSTNIKGTWNILEAARHCSLVKAVVVASSDKAYGIQNKLPYREDSPLAGCHPYDVSKSCTDLLAYTYFYTYGLAVCVTRCGNIYGPGDFNFSRIIPDALRSIIKGKTLLIRSDGKFTRDYIYIKDIVAGYLSLAEKMQKLNLSGEAFNFSNETPLSVLKLVRIISKTAGKPLRYRILNQAKYEIPRQYLSAAKAKKVLKWSPSYGLRQGLKKTIAWYRDYLEKGC